MKKTGRSVLLRCPSFPRHVPVCRAVIDSGEMIMCASCPAVSKDLQLTGRSITAAVFKPRAADVFFRFSPLEAAWVDSQRCSMFVLVVCCDTDVVCVCVFGGEF